MLRLTALYDTIIYDPGLENMSVPPATKLENSEVAYKLSQQWRLPRFCLFSSSAFDILPCHMSYSFIQLPWFSIHDSIVAWLQAPMDSEKKLRAKLWVCLKVRNFHKTPVLFVAINHFFGVWRLVSSDFQANRVGSDPWCCHGHRVFGMKYEILDFLWFSSICLQGCN